MNTVTVTINLPYGSDATPHNIAAAITEAASRNQGLAGYALGSLLAVLSPVPGPVHYQPNLPEPRCHVCNDRREVDYGVMQFLDGKLLRTINDEHRLIPCPACVRPVPSTDHKEA